MNQVYGGLLNEDIRVTIDDKLVFCPSDYTILEAAKLAGIEIPTLCYLKGLNPTGACGICAVEIVEEDGTSIIRRSCRCPVKDGMVIYTNSPAVMEYIIGSTIVKSHGGVVEASDIGLPVRDSGLTLPCGSSARWKK